MTVPQYRAPLKPVPKPETQGQQSMTIRRIHELDVDDARKFLIELVKRGLGDKENDSLEKLRLTEEHLRTIMHEAAEELRGVQGEIMIRIRQNYEARQGVCP